ncbi:uncharacterized protein A4U43_C06F15560 [Asparagus officinalis]|uniref:Uncharacterized protein n=1 Tax=Asparagus officinalis TaxID=4686 RepID=A0A5P1EPM2_ASPOF|nr:uncharacterized protein A4U43_C06F15560 [Asparagus officinalis]
MSQLGEFKGKERVYYDTNAYITDPDESTRGDDVDIEPTSEVNATMTTSSSVAEPAAKRPISIKDSSESIGDVPISPFP